MSVRTKQGCCFFSPYPWLQYIEVKDWKKRGKTSAFVYFIQLQLFDIIWTNGADKRSSRKLRSRFIFTCTMCSLHTENSDFKKIHCTHVWALTVAARNPTPYSYQLYWLNKRDILMNLYTKSRINVKFVWNQFIAQSMANGCVYFFARQFYLQSGKLLLFIVLHVLYYFCRLFSSISVGSLFYKHLMCIFCLVYSFTLRHTFFRRK